MATLDEQKRKITDELNWRTDAASGTARRLSLGVVAVVWGLLSSASPDSLTWLWWQPKVLALAGSLALASLFADWCQALSAYWAVQLAWNRVHSGTFDVHNDKLYVETRAYRVADVSFVAKQLLAPLGFVTLLVAVLPLVLRWT